MQSDLNYFNQLNLALNKEISKTFNTGKVQVPGAEVSKHKKTFLLEVGKIGNHESIEQLVDEFRIKYLQ